MFQGHLVAICITERKAASLLGVHEAEAIAGRGLIGDRYYLQLGTFSKPGADREITLIESEAIEALARECAITLPAEQARRNLVTRGVPLNHLIGHEFLVGEVLLKGIRLCEPCGHLEKLTVKGIEDGLSHRGGLRAQIVRGGLLHVGDEIKPHGELGV